MKIPIGGQTLEIIAGAVPGHSPPKAPEDRPWDATAAVDRLRRWASSDGSGEKEKLDWSKYSTGFAYVDSADRESFGAYHLPHHDVVDGEFVVVWRGVAAAMQRLGQTQMPASERARVHAHLARHYKQFDKPTPPAPAAAAYEVAADDSRYEFRAESGGSVDLLIYGRIFESAFADGAVGADRIARDLAAVPNATSINVKINSRGGDMFAGNAIYNALKNHPAFVTVYIDGVAASAASVVAMAGDRVVMPRNAMMMIHKPQVVVEGDDRALAAAADAVRKITAAFSTAYETKTGLEPARIMALMEAETWLTPEEAVEQGFADEIDLQHSVQARLEGSLVTVNGLAFETSAFRNVPQALLSSSASHRESSPSVPGRKTEDTMNIKELIASLRRRFGADRYPNLNKGLDAAETQIAENATAEDVAARLTTIFEGALSEAHALIAPLTAAGITTPEAVAGLLDKAKAADAYRADLIAEALASAVRAKGDKFDQAARARYERLFAAMSIDDIKALKAEWDADAKARFGGGGRQTTAQDPNATLAIGDKEADGDPAAVKAFLERTAPPYARKAAATD